jgi:hypothetical protein
VRRPALRYRWRMGKDDRDAKPPGRYEDIVWRAPDGSLVSCVEKLKVLRENLGEIEQACQDAFEDALLMGCDEQQIRDVFRKLIESLNNPYRRG